MLFASFELLKSFCMRLISLGLCKMMAMNLVVFRQMECLNLGYLVMMSPERIVVGCTSLDPLSAPRAAVMSAVAVACNGNHVLCFASGLWVQFLPL